MGEKFDATKSFLFENMLSVFTNYGKDFLQDEAIPLITNELVKQGGNMLLDYGASAIPGIGGAISEYRTNKKIKNLEEMFAILNEKNAALKDKFENQTLENKEVLDFIFEMVFEKIEKVSQKEKIRYMIDGYSEFLNLENPSFDVAYLYFDTLDKLTLLDIDTLKLSYQSMYSYFSGEIEKNNEITGYNDILSKYDIDYSQYKSVRENLLRMGLFENEYDNKIEKDYKNVEKAIKEIKVTVSGLYDVINGKKKVSDVKKLTSKSDVKFNAKDRLKISKFGRDFVEHFLLEGDNN